MVLLLDLGNTNLYVGVYRNGSLESEYRTHSDINKSADEYYEIIRLFLFTNGYKMDEFQGAILSSVIPSLTRTICTAVNKILKKSKCMVVGKGLKSGLSIRIDNPNELGSDLVCDSIGGKYRYSYPLLIADLGTANKILVIDKDGNFVGCTISPGIKISMKALNANTAQLMDVSLTAPEKVIGRNSVDSMNSGAVYGTISMLESMCNKMEDELGYKCKKIITGGYSSLIKDHIDNEFIFDPTLILEGLYQIYIKNGGNI